MKQPFPPMSHIWNSKMIMEWITAICASHLEGTGDICTLERGRSYWVLMFPEQKSSEKLLFITEYIRR